MTSSNSFAHFSAIADAIDGIKAVLRHGGDPWVEVHDLDATLASGQWDTIYHEHKVEWSSRSLLAVFVPQGFELLEMQRLPLHGGLLRAHFRRIGAALRLGASPGAVALLGRRADTTFWRPVAGPTDTVCSAGREMRDFPTLVEAMRDTGIPCHIATGVYPDGRLFETVKNLYRVGDLPAKVTVGSMTREELRALYGRSRFVVVPLHPTDTDNGATTIEEAMAMGKAVVCTRTAGQVDLVREGETGIMVPPHDPAALRAAIVRLWENPAETKDSLPWLWMISPMRRNRSLSH